MSIADEIKKNLAPPPPSVPQPDPYLTAAQELLQNVSSILMAQAQSGKPAGKYVSGFFAVNKLNALCYSCTLRESYILDKPVCIKNKYSAELYKHPDEPPQIQVLYRSKQDRVRFCDAVAWLFGGEGIKMEVSRYADKYGDNLMTFWIEL